MSPRQSFPHPGGNYIDVIKIVDPDALIAWLGCVCLPADATPSLIYCTVCENQGLRLDDGQHS